MMELILANSIVSLFLWCWIWTLVIRIRKLEGKK
jgi:hypothetical protein